MAPEHPDPRTFSSWEDAFQYPIPIIRRFEQQLQGNLQENKDKLRSLVGASYRDLLGTAECIIEMDHEMRKVETTLSVLSQKCNSRVVERRNKNYETWIQGRRVRDLERLSFAAHMAMLQNCSTVIARLLKSRHSVLAAARVLVLSRLVHKKLAQDPDAPALVDKLRNRLASLRRKLLAQIDRRIGSSGLDRSLLVEHLCAYALATSSMPTEILRHFQIVRLGAVREHLTKEGSSAKGISQAFQLLTRTLQEVDEIFPRHLEHHLAKLKIQPLLQSDDVRNLVELRLSTHERWMAEDIRNFTPWPRHDELRRADVDEALKEWAKQALDVFVNGLNAVSRNVNGMPELLQLREEVLKLCLSSSHRTPGVKARDVLDRLRASFSERLGRLAERQTEDLHRVTDHVTAVLEHWQPGVDDQHMSLWDPAVVFMESGLGAQGFTKAIIESRHGRNTAVRDVAETYESWSRSVQEMSISLKRMKDTRWDDDVEEDFYEEDDVGGPQRLLSEEDPSRLESGFKDGLSSASRQMDTKLTDAADSVSTKEARGPQTIFMLRSIREIRQRLPQSGSWPTIFSAQEVGRSAIPKLLSTLAEHVMKGPVASFHSSMEKFSTSSRPVARSLWDGEPPLPIQPSPTAFRLLHSLAKSMATAGSDLWAPAAVHTLKRAMDAELSQVFARVKTATATGQEAEQGSTRADEEAPSTTGKEKLTQVVFDVVYLQQALRVPQLLKDPPCSLSDFVAGVRRDVDLDEGAFERITRAATNYWRKTYLLFALLEQ